jgi:hypothetical protein
VPIDTYGPPGASHTPSAPRPHRACSCALPDDYASSSGWHLRPASDQACFELHRITTQTDLRGNVVVGCVRGAGRHACPESGQPCLYADVMIAMEACPRFRDAVERKVAAGGAS